MDNANPPLTEREKALWQAKQSAVEIAIRYKDRIAELEEVLQQVVDETAHLDCYSQATTNKILAAIGVE